MACRGGVRNAERHHKCGSCPKSSHALWSAQSLPSSSTVVHLASHPSSVCADFAEFSSFPRQYSCAAASSGARLLLMVPFLDTVSVCDLLVVGSEIDPPGKRGVLAALASTWKRCLLYWPCLDADAGHGDVRQHADIVSLTD